jgi:hypothetical protein
MPYLIIVIATEMVIVAVFDSHFGRLAVFVRLFVEYSRNPSAKAQDHKSPDQRKVNHVGNYRIEASYKKHLSTIVLPKLVNTEASCKQ